MQTRIKQIGLSLGVAAIVAVGYLGASGQYVPPVNRANTVATTAPCSTGERPEMDANGAWQCHVLNDYGSTELDYAHEFLNTAATDWINATTSGTGATATATASSTVGRPGVVDLSTGTTSTGLARWHGGTVWVDVNSMTATFEVTGGWPTLSTSTDGYASEIGFVANTGVVDQSNGCFFLYDERNVATGGQNSGNAQMLQVVSAKGSSRTIVPLDGSAHGGVTTVSTTVAALTLPNTNIHTYTVIASLASCVFKVDNSTVATLTTNVPSTAYVVHVFNILKNVGTTASHLYADRAHLHISLLAARSL